MATITTRAGKGSPLTNTELDANFTNLNSDKQEVLTEGAFVDGDKTKLDGIEAGADVTDTANVTAAGALMDSEVTNLAQVKAFDSSDYATAAQGALADSALQSIPDNYILNTGDSITGDLSFGDNDKAIFGAGSDLQIYHDGSNSYIKDNGTGRLAIQSASDFLISNTANTQNYFYAQESGYVRLYYSGATKLATSSTGIDVTGTVTADGLTVDGGSLGTMATFIGANDARPLLVTNYDGELSASAYAINAQSSYGEIALQTNTLDRLKVARTGDISFYEDTGTTPKFFWDASAESLGIGTSSPASLLHVGATTIGTWTDLTLQANSGWGSRIKFNDGSDSGIITYYHGDNSMRLTTNGSERMRIDSSGKLLVGKTSTSSAFAGAMLYGTGNVYGTVDGNYCARFNRLTSDGNIVELQKDGATVGSIGTGNTANFQIYNAQASHVGLEFGSPNIMPTNNSGSLTDGGAALGSSSYRFSDLYLSGGVYLGGTGSANYLDDYEEGTWTPATSLGTNYSKTGYYTKTGNQVTVWFRIDQISETSSIGSMIVTGLPFSIDGAQGSASLGSIMQSYVSPIHRNQVYRNSSTSFMFYGSETSGFNSRKYSDISNVGTDLYGFATYQTDA